jgi:hypothetical protein
MRLDRIEHINQPYTDLFDIFDVNVKPPREQKSQEILLKIETMLNSNNGTDTEAAIARDQHV